VTGPWSSPTVSVEPSYTALVEFVASCFLAGWYPDQTQDLLQELPTAGPGAQYHWPWLRHSDEDWFNTRWDSIATNERRIFYSSQLIKSNKTCQAGLITLNLGSECDKSEGNVPATVGRPTQPFVIYPETLHILRR
jgi:hypothetical protein